MSRQAEVAALLLERIRSFSPDDETIHSDIDGLCELLFRNHRTLRLSQRGFDLLQQHFAHHEVDLAGEALKNIHLVFLDRHLSLPWFLTRKGKQRQIILFESRAALELKLRDGSIDLLLGSKRTAGVFTNGLFANERTVRKN